eukprot:2163748-Alexandrium_andersonii.AAC.1
MHYSPVRAHAPQTSPDRPTLFGQRGSVDTGAFVRAHPPWQWWLKSASLEKALAHSPSLAW